jgi:putative tricarboxylic transport membrane protein
VVSRFVERRPWWWSVVVAVLAGVVLYVVFVVFLNVPLPGGPLGLGGDG